MTDDPDLPKPTPEQVLDAFKALADFVAEADGAMVAMVEVEDKAWQVHAGRGASQLLGMAELLAMSVKQRCPPAISAERKEP